MKNLAVGRFIRIRPHLSAAVVLGAVASLFLPSTWMPVTRMLAAWDVGVWAYLASMLWMMTRADHHTVRRLAAQQDEKGAVILAALSLVAIVSLAAIGIELAVAGDMAGTQRTLHYVFVGLTLLGSWLLPGVMFCFHYAHLYYLGDAKHPPLAFPDGDTHPDYWDFLYFSFTIAVAAQTSDVAVRSAALRKLVLGQSVLAFFFNLVILGMSINIAAGVLNN
jgi:uncharacterized membrane protein